MRVDPSKIIPTSEDNAENWIVFHKALKSWFGKQGANANFLKFWNQRAGAGSSADTHDLREYMESQDVDLTTDFKGEMTDFGMGIVDWFGDTANVLRVVAVGAIIVGIGLVVFYVVNRTSKGHSGKDMLLNAPLPQLKATHALKGTSNVKLLS